MSYDANKYIESIRQKIEASSYRIRIISENINDLVDDQVYNETVDNAQVLAEEAKEISALVEILEIFKKHRGSATDTSKALGEHLNGELRYREADVLFYEYQMLLLNDRD